MTYRKMFLWSILLVQLSFYVVYILGIQGHGNSIDSTIGLLTHGALSLLPSSAESSVLLTSDYVLVYWFLALGIAFILSIFLASLLAITEGKKSFTSRALWLLSFVFIGFIAVPAYCIIKLRDKSSTSAV